MDRDGDLATAGDRNTAVRRTLVELGATSRGAGVSLRSSDPSPCRCGRFDALAPPRDLRGSRRRRVSLRAESGSAPRCKSLSALYAAGYDYLDGTAVFTSGGRERLAGGASSIASFTGGRERASSE